MFFSCRANNTAAAYVSKMERKTGVIIASVLTTGAGPRTQI